MLQLPACMEIVANRVYASRKGRFSWMDHPDTHGCHLLDFVEFTEQEKKAHKELSKDERRLAGQRGLSMKALNALGEFLELKVTLGRKPEKKGK